MKNTAVGWVPEPPAAPPGASATAHMSSNTQPTTDRATRQRDRPRAGARTVPSEDPWAAGEATAGHASARAALVFDPFCGRDLPNTFSRTNRAMPDTDGSA